MAEKFVDLEFVEFVVKAIVSKPDEVKVTRHIDELGVLICLEIAKDDMGTVIGKNGQTAKAIRTLLRVIGSKNNARVNFKIIDPDKDSQGGGQDDLAESLEDIKA